jgi:hypothetical protein
MTMVEAICRPVAPLGPEWEMTAEADRLGELLSSLADAASDVRRRQELLARADAGGDRRLAHAEALLGELSQDIERMLVRTARAHLELQHEHLI